MTLDELKAAQNAVDAARSLAGSIAIVRERMAWLESGEALIVAFDRGASDPPNVSTRTSPAVLSGTAAHRVREIVYADYAAQLAAMSAKFESLSFGVKGG